jgi:hypothetical protein
MAGSYAAGDSRLQQGSHHAIKPNKLRSSRSPKPTKSAKSTPTPQSNKPEECDYIINWNISYVCSLMNSAAANIDSFADQIRAEIVKIESDANFISESCAGPHSHLNQLNNTKNDISDALSEFTALVTLAKNVSQEAAKRVPV